MVTMLLWKYRIHCIANFKALPPLKTPDCDIQHGPDSSITIRLNETSCPLYRNYHIASLKGCHIQIRRLRYNVAGPLHLYNMLYCYIASTIPEPSHKRLCTPSLKEMPHQNCDYDIICGPNRFIKRFVKISHPLRHKFQWRLDTFKSANCDITVDLTDHRLW